MQTNSYADEDANVDESHTKMSAISFVREQNEPMTKDENAYCITTVNFLKSLQIFQYISSIMRYNYLLACIIAKTRKDNNKKGENFE